MASKKRRKETAVDRAERIAAVLQFFLKHETLLCHRIIAADKEKKMRNGMKAFAFVIIILFCILIGTIALADNWTCPGCGRINDDDMNFCGNCRTKKPEPDGVHPSDAINAWVCSACKHICPDADNFCTKCGTDHYDTDAKAFLAKKPVYEKVNMPSCVIQRIPSNFSSENVAASITVYTEGVYYFWIEDQVSDFSAKMVLYDSHNNVIRSNDFYDNDPGFAYRLSSGETYNIVLKGNGGSNSYYTLCIGQPRETEMIGSRCIIQDSIDYYYQENSYCFFPEVTGEYRIDITEMQNGQELDVEVKDELGYVIQSSYFGITMGNGISFDAEENKLYFIIVGERRNLGYYKLSLSSPQPMISITGCNAIGDYLYYWNQKNEYEFIAPETGEYSFSFAFAEADCDFRISIYDQYGYAVSRGGYSSECSADLTAGEKYRIEVKQRSGKGDYSLFIVKNQP